MDAIKQTLLRVIIYARVSTDEQGQYGYSLDTQIESCRQYAERLGLTVVAIFRDDISGKIPIADRPEGKKAVAMLKQREAGAILGHTVDRFSRDLVDQLTYVRTWLRAGVQVHACDVGQIKSENDIVLVIKGWQSSDEHSKIIERTSRGRYGKAKSGKVVGSGYAPYGYRYIDGRFEIVDAEAKIVRLIYTWYVDGKLNILSIARKLSEIGVPTPGERFGSRKTPYRTSHTTIWYRSAIWRILTDELYAGVYRYGKTILDNGNRGKRPIEEQVPVQVPAIVGPTIWKAAQMQVESNKLAASRNSKMDYPLRGRVRCGECNGAMDGCNENRGTRNLRYYRCRRGMDYYKGLQARPCQAKRVRADVLESKTWEYLGRLAKNRKELEQLLLEAQAQQLQQIEPKREELAAVLEQIAQSEADAHEITEVLRKVRKGGAAEKNLLADMERVEGLYAEQIKKRDKLQSEINAGALTDQDIESALQYQQDFEAGLRDPTPENLRRALEIFHVEISVKNQRGIIKTIFPKKNGVIDFSTWSSTGTPWVN
jgi:site-specific DNA recombinase